MNKRIIRIVTYSLVLLLGVFICLAFYPRTYDVPQLLKRGNIQYWDLPTGSRIGYTLVPAKGSRKPFPVIFLQGGPGGFISDETVENFVPLSHSGYDVYLYDQVGSGHSGRLENIEEYSVSRHKKDLEAIVKKTGAEKVILIGQSWGAVLATLFVADHPDNVDRLIFTGPGPIFPLRKELENIKAPDSLHLKEPLASNRQANEKVSNLRIKTIFLWAKLFGCKLAPDKEVDDFQTLLANETNKSTVCDTSKARKAKGGGGYYASIMTMQSLYDVQDPRPKLKNSRVPLYIMKGQCDNQKWGYITEYLEFFPHHRLVVIPNAGHSISIEQPELYLKTLYNFISE
jgi:proline iminopeptidase